jgi:SAM-dependent methyltransferase
MEQNTEFDRYAQNYEQLLCDSLRDRFAQNSEFYHARKWKLISDFLQKHSIPYGKLSWLDIGCGKGELLRYGRARFDRVVGCDPSAEMVRGVGGMEVYLQNVPDALPFPDDSFDFATAVCVYHHVDEAARMPLTREIRRILRPNGIFCMIEHNPFNPLTRLIVNRCPVDVDAHLVTARRSKRYISEAGLQHVELQYFLYLPQKYFERIGGVERIFRRLPLGGQYAAFARK